MRTKPQQRADEIRRLKRDLAGYRVKSRNVDAFFAAYPNVQLLFIAWMLTPPERAGGFASEILDAAQQSAGARRLHWHFDGQPYAPRVQPPRVGIRIRCVEAGEEFLSIGAAVTWLKQRTGRKAWPNGIREAIDGGGTSNGYHWTRVD
jgi:hypothetical protein